MNYCDSGRPGEIAIDHYQMFHKVRRDAKHRELKLAILRRQSKQLIQCESNYGCALDRFNADMRSILQQHGKQSHHRSTLKDVAMDLLAKPIEKRACESSGDDKVNVVDLRIQVDDDLTGLELRQLGRGGNILDDLFLELVSPVQSLELDAEPLLVEIHGHTP
jgi:hypothetical protein